MATPLHSDGRRSRPGRQRDRERTFGSPPDTRVVYSDLGFIVLGFCWRG
jgi:hypothetical protein